MADVMGLARAAGRIAPPEAPGAQGEATDVLERARETVVLVMDGKGGRNATARLRAAEMLLGKSLLSSLSDDDLLAEVRRRADARGKP